MKLNPFIKLKLDCLVTMEQAWERLRSVTKERSFFTPETGLAFKKDNLRYQGKLDDNRFTITKRDVAHWHGLPYYQHQAVVIKGRIEPGGSGCMVNITIRPMLQLLFGWFLTGAVFLGLLAGVLTTSYAGGEMFVGMAICFLVFWVLSLRFRKAVKEESEFLKVLFGSKPQTPVPTMAPAIG